MWKVLGLDSKKWIADLHLCCYIVEYIKPSCLHASVISIVLPDSGGGTANQGLTDFLKKLFCFSGEE